MGVYLGKNYSAMQGPASDGFHVPLSSEWQSIIDMLTTLGLITTQDKPLSNTNLLTYLKAAGSGFLDKDDGSAINLNSRSCTYWCCDKYADKAGFSYYFTSDNSGPRVYRNAQSMAYAVRAFKDNPTVPDNSWTAEYQGTGNAGIFHNASLGLISISSNGNTYITIQDKDVGASSVWNYGDTKDNNNCGKKFQRGNNYGFPRQNATPTSSTQVDATNYGPGNYYSSSTFITQSGRTSWDSSDNGNLWGGETEVKPASLKNAYIGEYNNKYVYDFTTKTIADLTTDGWTNIDSNMAIDSNGIYNTGSGQKGPNYILNSSASKSFTFKYYFMSTTVGSRTGTTTQNEGSTSSMGGTYYGLMTNSNYKLRWGGQYGSGSATNSITWSANTWYIGTHTVDLVNKTLTVTVATENAPDTALVTLSKDISSIIGNITPMDRIGIRLEKNYVRCKRVEVTRD